VARRERNNPHTLEVQVTFEPSRLRSTWMAQAYEQVVPITRRVTSQARPGRQTGHAEQTPQGERYPLLGYQT